PDDDYRGFLRRRAPEMFRAGAIVDRRGSVVGMHAGIAAYTIGRPRRRRAPESARAVAIVDRRGSVVGMHAGIAAYTIGQRRGLGLATGRPLYVVDLDAARNTVRVGGAGA